MIKVLLQVATLDKNSF